MGINRHHVIAAVRRVVLRNRWRVIPDGYVRARRRGAPQRMRSDPG